LKKYDEAIAAFQKGLALNGLHASSEFGLARALQRKGDAAAAREHLARFQKITTEHLGTPFGAGYGDQGRYSLAELPLNSVVDVPAAIPVRFTPEANAFVSKSAGEAALRSGRAPALASLTTMATGSRIFFWSAARRMAPAACCTI